MKFSQEEEDLLETLLHAHAIFFECKQKIWELCENGRRVKMMWIPLHVGVAGNEAADMGARQAILGELVYGIYGIPQNTSNYA
jgi:ribonuclease HI